MNAKKYTAALTAMILAFSLTACGKVKTQSDDNSEQISEVTTDVQDTAATDLQDEITTLSQDLSAPEFSIEGAFKQGQTMLVLCSNERLVWGEDLELEFDSDMMNTTDKINELYCKKPGTAVIKILLDGEETANFEIKIAKEEKTVKQDSSSSKAETSNSSSKANSSSSVNSASNTVKSKNSTVSKSTLNNSGGSSKSQNVSNNTSQSNTAQNQQTQSNGNSDNNSKPQEQQPAASKPQQPPKQEQTGSQPPQQNQPQEQPPSNDEQNSGLDEIEQAFFNVYAANATEDDYRVTIEYLKEYLLTTYPEFEGHYVSQTELFTNRPGWTDSYVVLESFVHPGDENGVEIPLGCASLYGGVTNNHVAANPDIRSRLLADSDDVKREAAHYFIDECKWQIDNLVNPNWVVNFAWNKRFDDSDGSNGISDVCFAVFYN